MPARTDPYVAGSPVYSRSGKLRGVLTGGRYCCRLDGCSGLRVAVRWPDRHAVTFPCTKGLRERHDGALQIG